MDSDEEAALIAIIIDTFTENIKRKKRRKRKEWMKPWFQRRQHIPETLCFLISSCQFLFFSVLFDFAVFTPPNLNCFSTSLFFAIYHTFCLKVCGMLISNF